MNDKEAIKNKFLNFEPEVDELVINKNWEQIKYFVPQKEKKRRGLFFFLYGTLAFLLISSLIFIVSFFPKNSLDVSEKQISIPQKNKKTANVEIVSSKENNNSFVRKQNKKNSAKQITTNIAQQKALAAYTIASNTKKEVSISSNANANKNTESIVSQQNKFIDTETVFEKGPVIYDQLPLLPFKLLPTEKNSEISPAFNPNYYLPKPVSLISIDLFGGIQQTHTVIKLNNNKQNNTNLNYLAGIGINYHLRNKLSVTGQFIYSRNNFNYTNTVTENKVTKQVLSITSGPTSANIDTTYYIHANTNYIIRSNASYNFALGAEYKFLQKNKLSLGTFALFNVSATKYNYGYTMDYGKDVMIYVNGGPNPPSANLSPPSFKEGDYFKEENRISAGLMPGILLSYRLNKKASLIFKPAYFITLSETNLIINSSSFRLKENSLLLNVGLRIAL
ncbi:MAG: outer membrane beta-barrel protein [Bacteroidota bacterium]|nr:outer membrane beta-barrel protein [Bacteroidota bacterium]